MKGVVKLHKEQEKTVIALFLFTVCQLIASLFIPSFGEWDAVRRLLLYVICMSAPVIFLGYPSFRISDSGKMPERPVLTLFACMGAMCVCDRVCAVIGSIFSSFGVSLSPNTSLYDGDMPISVVISFISLVILPPLAEEYLFRGLVISHLLPHGKWQAVAFSALLFAFFHMNFLQIPYALACGALFGFITVKTGSVRFAVLLHFINNLSAFIITLLNADAFAVAVYSASLIVLGAICGAILLKGKRYSLPHGLSPSFISPSAYLYFIMCIIFAFGGIQLK